MRTLALLFTIFVTCVVGSTEQLHFVRTESFGLHVPNSEKMLFHVTTITTSDTSMGHYSHTELMYKLNCPHGEPTENFMHSKGVKQQFEPASGNWYHTSSISNLTDGYSVHAGYPMQFPWRWLNNSDNDALSLSCTIQHQALVAFSPKPFSIIVGGLIPLVVVNGAAPVVARSETKKTTVEMVLKTQTDGCEHDLEIKESTKP